MVLFRSKCVHIIKNNNKIYFTLVCKISDNHNCGTRDQNKIKNKCSRGIPNKIFRQEKRNECWC